MTHDQLVNIILTGHGSVLLIVLAAFFKYGDSTDIFTKSLQGTESTMRLLRQRISQSLARCLSPIFENPGTDPTPIITPSEETYFERPINPVGSEVYNETIHEFIGDNNEALVDYRSLLIARNSWCFWARIISWSLTILVFWQILTIVMIFFTERILWYAIHNCVLYTSAVITTIGVIFTVTSLFPLQHHHGLIMEKRRNHDKF